MIENSRPSEIEPESRGVSRRTVMRTAAWTAPVVSVAAAAPAYASSTSATLTAANPVVTPSQRSASDVLQTTLTINGSPAPDGTAVTFASTASWLSLSAPAVSTSGGAADVTATYVSPWPAPGSAATVVASYVDADSVTHTTSFTVSYVPNLTVVRVGSGSAALSNAATAVFLDEFTAAGASGSPSIAMPTAVTGANFPLTMSGTATSEGMVSLSPDRTQLALAGYTASAGTASVSGTTAAAVPRVVGVVDKTGAIDTRTELGTQFSANNPRAAVAGNGNAWAVGANSGIVTAAIGATSATAVSTTSTNNKAVGIFAGEIYISTGSGTNRGIYKVAGTPTASGNTATLVTPAGVSGGSPTGFVVLAVAGGGLDTIYVADDSAGLNKYVLNGSSFVAAGSLAVTGGLRGLTGYVDAATQRVVLFATSAASTTANTLVTITDNAAPGQSLAATAPSVLATAPANTVFRGVAFCPDA